MRHKEKGAFRRTQTAKTPRDKGVEPMSETQSTTNTCIHCDEPAVTADPTGSDGDYGDRTGPKCQRHSRPAPTWRDCPKYHTSGVSMAIKLRAIADAVESLGDTEIAETWLGVDFQVSGSADPQGRKAAVDAIASALGLNPATGGRHDHYHTGQVHGATVFTAKLHQPGCCEHCTVAGS